MPLSKLNDAIDLARSKSQSKSMALARAIGEPHWRILHLVPNPSVHRPTLNGTRLLSEAGRMDTNEAFEKIKDFESVSSANPNSN